tara:strand:- start:773 stop:3136 length:2364 start_codon:yes stop_codon:yes gene_type:complete
MSIHKNSIALLGKSVFIFNLLICFILSGHCLLGQVGFLDGIVFQDSEPLEFSRVSIPSLSKNYLSNNKGEFHFSELPFGSFDVVITAIGLKAVTKTILLTEESPRVHLKIILSVPIMELDDIVITGTKTYKRQTNSNVIVNVLTGESLEALQSCNLAEGLRFQPGLRVETDCQTCNYTQLRMNGLAGGYSQILINGRPIFSPLTGLYGLEQLPVNMIERIEVIRGGGSSLYGSSAIGGTVNVITKLPRENNFDLNYTYQNINALSSDQILNGNYTAVSKDRNMGLSFFFNSRRREFYDHNEDGYSELPKLNNNSFGLTSFFLPKENHKLELSVSNLNEYRYGGDMREDLPVYERGQAEERTHHVWMASGDYQINFNQDLSSFILYAAYQYTNRDHYTGIFPNDSIDIITHMENPPYGVSDISTVNTGIQLNHKLVDFLVSGENVITFGAEFLRDVVFDEIPAYNYLIDQQLNDIGLFLQSDWALLPNLNLLSGCRVDAHNLVDKLIWSPRVSLLYKLKKNTQFRLSYGAGFRAPQAFDTDLHIAFAGGGVSRVALADGLHEERSESWSASVNFDKPYDNFIAGFTIEGFYTKLEDAFFLQPNGEDEFGYLFEKQNGQAAIVQGITVELRSNYKRKLQLEAGFTIQTNEFEETVEYIEGVQGLTRFVRTPNDYGFAVLNFNPNKRFGMNLNYVYTGKMLVPHFSGAPNQSDNEIINADSFSNVSVKFTYSMEIKKSKIKLDLYSGIKNIFNDYQDSFDVGKNRDSNFIYGPAQPRTFFVGIKISSSKP